MMERRDIVGRLTEPMDTPILLAMPSLDMEHLTPIILATWKWEYLLPFNQVLLRKVWVLQIPLLLKYFMHCKIMGHIS